MTKGVSCRRTSSGQVVKTMRELPDRQLPRLPWPERTGVSSDRPPERYLRTDAFEVRNYLGLADAIGEAVR